MPRLIRGVARTAVVAGTATAVSGRVQRRQAEKYAARDEQIAATRTDASSQQNPPPPSVVPVPAPPASGGTDLVAMLKELAELRDQGILTEEEFTAQKAKILG